jgi:lipopolysaccharide biosynthesis protein
MRAAPGVRRRRALAASVPGLQRLLAYAAAPAAWVRSHRQIVFAWPDGPVALGPDIALLCQYAADGRLRPGLLRYIRELRDCGFDPVLIANSGNLAAEALAELRPLCSAVLVRRNVGYDFCAWRDAMERLGLPRAGTGSLLLANDSVFGPIRPLAPLLTRLRGERGFWGMTDSAERGHHLQSYFLLAQRDVLDSPAWHRFWRGVRPLASKWHLVGRYEVGLTRRLARAGVPVRAVFPSAAAQAGTSVANPTLQAWDQLLAAGMPFIKRELLRDDPLGDPRLATWRDQVARAAGAWAVAEIERELADSGGRLF